MTRVSTVETTLASNGRTLNSMFFFHEYGRRVGMVPRSSLKEGKNSQMVEKRTKTTQQPNNRKPQLHHLVVFYFLCAKVKQVKRKLLTINGPEFSNEEHGSAGLCSSKVSKKSSNGFHFSITSDQRPLHGVAKTWSRCRSRALLCSNAGCIHVKVDQWLLCFMPWKKPFL